MGLSKELWVIAQAVALANFAVNTRSSEPAQR
jgi:hypothetical protein